MVRSGSAIALAATGVACVAGAPSVAYGINGGTLQVAPRNGWKAFEVITQGNNPAGDGFAYAMPTTFDGVGAWLSSPSNIRLAINHETSDASISEVNLNLASFQTAISSMISVGNTGGGSFVSSARQAYGRWSNDGGGTFTNTSDNTTTAFSRFCSGQFHPANTFGAGRGFADNIYMTGEEASGGRMFALDVAGRDIYRLGSATVGVAPGGAGTPLPGGTGGMPSGPWENGALIDTGESNHVAILLSPDVASPATDELQLYIGVKGKDFNGNASNGFLARNGLAYGNFYYLNQTLPVSGTVTGGTFDTTTAGALAASKLEDVDTNPNDPTQVVLGAQDSGLFTFDFSLNFTGAGGSFNAGTSSFSLTKVKNHTNDTDGVFGDADNVDWTAATTLNGTPYSNGLIFVNEDSGTGNGEVWMMKPDGSGLVLIGDTADTDATETSGILDISTLVGYMPGSVLLTSNQGSVASLTVLINPNATLVPEPGSVALLGLAGTLLSRRRERRRAAAGA